MKTSPLTLPDATANQRATLYASLEELEAFALSLCVDLSPGARRCILTHMDLREPNVLVSENGLEGIIDWEYNASRPAVLALEYPVWLRATGAEDPLHANPDWELWTDSPGASAHLRRYFDHYMRECDVEAWYIFDGGAKAAGCRRMDDKTWPGSGPNTLAEYEDMALLGQSRGSSKYVPHAAVEWRVMCSYNYDC